MVDEISFLCMSCVAKVDSYINIHYCFIGRWLVNQVILHMFFDHSNVELDPSK